LDASSGECPQMLRATWMRELRVGGVEISSEETIVQQRQIEKLRFLY
jgi:hypothetical protein